MQYIVAYFFRVSYFVLERDFFPLIDCHIRLVVSFINFLKLTQMILYSEYVGENH